MDDEIEKFISITHFINPYQFWYICVDEDTFIKVSKIEDRITELYKNSYMKPGLPLKIGDNVAVRFLPSNKYIRSRIEEIMTKSCIVWSLDHGFPFETKVDYIRELPEQLAFPIDRVRSGGIARVLPAECEFDFIKQSSAIVIKEKWNERACVSLENIITDAASLGFTEKFSINGHYWGDLIVTSHHGKVILASDYLINENVAVRDIKKFKEMCCKSNSFDVCTWQTNSGNNKFRKNIAATTNSFNISSEMERVQNVNDTDFQSAQFKVAAWSDFNKRATVYPEKKELCPTLDRPSTVYDFDMDDSVSQAALSIPDDMQSLSLTERGIHRKVNQLPPKPNLEDFQIHEETNNPKVPPENYSCKAESDFSHCKSDTSKKSSRSQYLQTLRKKLQEKEENQNQSEKVEAKCDDSLLEKSLNIPFCDAKSNMSTSTARRSHLSMLRKRLLETQTNQISNDNEKNNTALVVKSNNQKSTKQSRPKTVPAGFDLTNLVTYNRKDHWHRKETTRNEHHPHDSFDSTGNDSQKQDFRFTRNHSDKHKNNSNFKLKSFLADKTTIEGDFAEFNFKNVVTADKERKDFFTGNLRTENSADKVKQSLKNEIKNNELEKIFFPTTKTNKVITKYQSSTNNVNESEDDSKSDSDVSSEASMYSARSFSSHQCFEDAKLEANKKTPTKNLSPTHNKKKSFIKNQNDLPDLQTRWSEDLVLAHSQHEVSTIEREVFSAPIVKQVVQSMCIDKLFRTQAFAWSQMTTGHGLFLVNASRTGKTCSYIPALCTIIKNTMETSNTPSTYGPMAIVIVPSAEHVIETSGIFNRLFQVLDMKEAICVGCYGLRTLAYTKITLMESCAILVTTAPNFCRLFKDNKKDPLFDPSRLKHIILDDIDLMLARCKEQFVYAVESLKSFAPKLNKSKTLAPQLVATSKFYLPMFEKLIPMSSQPLLVIGDFLEAAVYGKAKFIIKLCPKNEKINEILNFIADHPVKDESLMILCNCDEDVFNVVENLNLAGINTIGYHTDSSMIVREEIFQWKYEIRNHKKVLVCCDSVFPELQIQSVQNLIHYSLAKSWTRFTIRFSSHLKLYENFISRGFHAPPPESIITSLVLLDEENNLELPRLIEFLKCHNRLKQIPPEVLKLNKQIIKQREAERVTINTPLCKYLLSFGRCDESMCTQRHILTAASDIDASKVGEPLLQCGEIQVHVLKVFSPTHYAVRLLKHRESSSSAWRVVQRSNEAAGFALKFNLFYSQERNLKMHWPIQVDDLCVYLKQDKPCRARILEMKKVENENNLKRFEIKMRLIDAGEILVDNSESVFVLDAAFKSFPPQAIDVRLLGLLPFDNERNWDDHTTKYVRGILSDNLKKNECVHGKIKFSLIDTIFLDSVVVIEKLPTINSSVYRIHLRRHMADNNYGVIDAEATQRMEKLLKEHGIEHVLNSYESQKITEMYKNKKAELDAEEHPKILEVESKSEDCAENTRRTFLAQKASATESEDDFSTDEDSNFINKNPIDTLQRPSRGRTESEGSNDSDQRVDTFSDFMKCLENCDQFDAEELDGFIENLPEIAKKCIQETKARYTAAITEENRKNKETPKCLKIEEFNETYYTKEELQDTKKEFNQTEIVDDSTIMSLPKLLDLHPRPKTVWYETNYAIILSIEAPDIGDYFLEVTQTWLYFKATVRDVDQVLVLNFLGTIDPSYVSHEIRGLNVVVRLLKSVFMKWPRLLQEEEKVRWLRYNLNTINIEEMDIITPQQTLNQILADKKSYNDDNSDSDVDDEENNFQTYTPIVNSEDKNDPMNAEFY